MTRYIPLSELAAGATRMDRNICRRAGEWVALPRLRSDVAHNTYRLRSRVKPGTKVLLSCSDAYWFVVGMWASLHAGARLVFPPNRQPGTVSDYGSRVALTISDATEVTGHKAFVPEHGDEGSELAPLVAENSWIDFYTSGSTDEPKCIAKTLRQLETEVRNLETLWGESVGQGKVLSTVSHSHIYGFTFGILWPLVGGRPFDTSAHEIWESLISELGEGAIIVSSPAHLSRFPESINVPDNRRPRAVYSAGAPLPWRASRETFERLGCWPTEIYGSTETGGVAYRFRNKEDVSWIPFDGVKLGSAVAGKLRIRSAYLRDSAWHELDDLAEVTNDQSFRLNGRADRVVKIEGKRASLPEIEARIVASECFLDAAAVVVGDRREVIGAAAVLTEAGRCRLSELGSFKFNRHINARLRIHLEPATIPKKWRFVDKLPVNSQGKKLAADIRALFDQPSSQSLIMPDIRAVRHGEDSLEIDMFVSGDLLYFQGHFPETPVLPGIVQLDWAVTETRRHLRRTGSVLNIRNLKYRRLIPPNSELTLVLRNVGAGGRVSFEFFGGETIYSSGNLIFTTS